MECLIIDFISALKTILIVGLSIGVLMWFVIGLIEKRNQQTYDKIMESEYQKHQNSLQHHKTMTN